MDVCLFIVSSFPLHFFFRHYLFFFRHYPFSFSSPYFDILLYFPFVIVLGLLHHCDNKICYQQGGYFFSSLTVIGDILLTGLLIFCGKKSKILRDFQGQICRKISQFHRIFAGKKSKFAEKSANFWDFHGKKVKIRGKIGRFCGIFAGEKSKFAEKLADFAGF